MRFVFRNLGFIGISFNSPMAKRGGGFSSVFREWGELLFQTDFLAIGISLGSLKNLSDGSYRLRQREGEIELCFKPWE